MIGKGYNVNNNALEVIDACDNWYANREITEFHIRKNMNDQEMHLARMNFAKRCCADDANLCEIISVAPDEDSASEEFIDELLTANRFDVRYREQLEKTSATGTVGAYIYLRNADYYERNGTVQIKGGDIRINYCDAGSIIPLTVENHFVTECAFAATNITRGKERTTLVIFTINDAGLYEAETVVFDEMGSELKDLRTVLTLGDVRPFAIMTNAEVNNLDDMEGYGLPKIYNEIPLFQALDLCYNLLFGDLDHGEKMVFINELLACVKKNEDGTAKMTPQQKKLFILLGDKLPDQDSIVKEYNPEIRTAEITQAFELILSLISMQFGYGTKKYTFENGQITTATEYIGERQDEMQELNKQRKQAEDYIADIIHACMWFSNTFHGTAFDTTEELNIEFDDSYIEDRAAKLENMRNDAMTFSNIPWLTEQYIKERYNLTDEELEEIMGGSIDEEEEDDEDLAEDFGDEEELDLDALLADL